MMELVMEKPISGERNSRVFIDHPVRYAYIVVKPVIDKYVLAMYV